MGSKLSKVRTPTAAASNTSDSSLQSASADYWVEQRASQESRGCDDSVFFELLSLIVRQKGDIFLVVEKWSTRWMMCGTRVNRVPGFKQHDKELEMLLEASQAVESCFRKLKRHPDKQAGEDKQADLVRALVVLYDDMTQDFERDLKELMKVKKSEGKVVKKLAIQSCTARAKGLRDRLEALVSTFEYTFVPPKQELNPLSERSFSALPVRRVRSLSGRRASAVAEGGVEALPKRSVSAPPERRADTVYEQSVNDPPEIQWHKETPRWT